MSAPLLKVEDLIVEFDTPKGRKRVVDGVSFHVMPGEVLGILGESGSGKTISTLAVLGLVAGEPGVMGGQIHWHGKAQQLDLLGDLAQHIRRKGDRPAVKNMRSWGRAVHRRMRPLWGQAMTAVFQNPRHALDPLMTIGAQLEESIRLDQPALSKAALKEEAVRWLARVQMNRPQRVYESYAHELSGGMCQRAMIAVALARRPQLLIADEPTTGLDTTVRAEIVALFKELLADRSRSMLYISHDIREVLYLADRVIVMRHGRVIEEQRCEDLKQGRGQRHPYTASLLQAAQLPSGGEPAGRGAAP